MTLPEPRAWTENSIPEWGKRCDKCKRRFVYARFHEFHGPLSDDGISGTWWRECMDCSFATVAGLATEYRESFLRSLGEELEAAR